MFNLNAFVQKAQSFIDATAAHNAKSDSQPSKAALFRLQFRLPDSQNPLNEITAELTVDVPRSSKSSRQPIQEKQKPQGAGSTYVGKLHLSESFLCFSTQPTSFHPSASVQASSAFTGQTQGAGPAGNGFTLPLCAIRRVERLHTPNSLFALAITTWNGITALSGKQGSASDAQRFTIQLGGSRQASERFCDCLKKGLRDGMKEVENLKAIIRECYSEFLLSGATKAERDAALAANGLKEAPDTGLGTLFRYPGDAKKLRDQSKIRLWREYLRDNGRNATLIRQPTFHKLIRVGLPNRLRGELWELCSGSLYMRLQKPKLYTDTLAKFYGKESLAIDEIEKDLNRSLPEYPGFQSEEGIGRLRRVLTAYSWTNEEVGYCQAMNIVVAALLMHESPASFCSKCLTDPPRYMSETQAFFLLSVLCDRLLPGYYSTTMYGTLLDQRVFESLVEKTMPILWDHLVKSDVQLSVVSLPWFLSLYINSMPLIFAFRVLDVFFLEGPKVLFQIGLAILRINGEELLDITDDGTFISILKNYFSRLDESAHPKSENEKVRGITKFQELMVVAFKEFGGITQGTISEQRSKHKDAVLNNIESFAKRTSIRNLGPDSKKLSLDDLGFLYDRFYSILYERQQRMQMMREQSDQRAKASKIRATELVTGIPGNTSVEIGRVGLGPSPTLMNYDGFREFLAGITKWAVTDSPTSQGTEHEREGSIYSNHSGRSPSASIPPWGNGAEPADHDFLQRLYGKWNKDDNDGLSLQDVVTGLAHVKGTSDIMTSISYFFDLYDDDHDGKVDREGILRISEALLFLTRRGLGGTLTPSSPSMQSLADDDMDTKLSSADERFLGSISAFIRRCFEYADPDRPQNQSDDQATPVAETLDNFVLGDSDSDTQEDLLDLGTKASPPASVSTAETSLNSDSTKPSTNHPTRSVSINRPTHTANLALDPTRPLHITLPTFRMVILADELLQQFFESSFPASFHLSAHPNILSTPSTPALTTFASPIPSTQSSNLASAGPRAGGVVAPSKGIRGVLDNIVQDGMHLAIEVRRRVDDVGREIERSATQRESEMDDEEHDHDAEQSDRKSVREDDRDLLEGAEAEAGGAGGGGGGGQHKQDDEDLLGDLGGATEAAGVGSVQRGKVEFER